MSFRFETHTRVFFSRLLLQGGRGGGGEREEREKRSSFGSRMKGPPPLPFIKIGYIAHIAVFGAKKLSLFSFDPLGY